MHIAQKRTKGIKICFTKLYETTRSVDVKVQQEGLLIVWDYRNETRFSLILGTVGKKKKKG